MTGKREGNNRCPLCGGRLRTGQATVPFLWPNAVILVKDVPAEICSSCHEPYTTGKVTDQIVSLLNEEASNEALVWSAMKASEAAFARVWDNEEDAVYDLFYFPSVGDGQGRQTKGGEA